jgi:hypothetical protein
MGELAVANPQQARRIQLFLATVSENDIMPETADLPEFMPEAEFKRRYGGIQGEAYRRMMDEITHRIEVLEINKI